MNRFELRAWWMPVILVAVAVLAYGSSVGGGFVQDDVALIENNRSFDRPLPALFGQSYREGTPIETDDALYRPLVIATFALQNAMTGLDPAPFHFVNVSLHAAVVLLLFAVVRRLLSNDLAGFATAAVFAAHAAISEAVMNCSGRAELLAALLALTAWWVLLRDDELERRAVTLSLAAVSALLALLAKESAVALPGLVLLGDLFRQTQRGDGASAGESSSVLGSAGALPAAAVQRLAVLSTVVLVYLGVRFAVLGRLGLPASEIPFLDNPAAAAPEMSRVFTALAVIGRYVLLLLAPLRLSSDYSFDQMPVLASPDGFAILGALIVAGAFALGFLRAPVARVGALGLLWFFGSLVLASNLFFPVGTIMAERLLYVPAMGACALFGYGVTRLDRKIAMILVAVAVVALGGRTMARATDWRDVDAFNEAALASAPNSVKALYNAGNSAREAGNTSRAIELYRGAVERLDEYGKAWTNLGTVLFLEKKYEEAERALERGVELSPSEVTAYASLAEVQLATDRAADAAATLESATSQVGRGELAARVFIRLAEARILAGDRDGARAAFETALERAPENAEALLRVARIRLSDGSREEAVDMLRRAVQNDPNHVAAQQLLSQIGQ